MTGVVCLTYRNDTVGQYAVNLDVGVLFSGEVGLRNRELFGGSLVRVKPGYVGQHDGYRRGSDAEECQIYGPSVAKGVVQHGLGLELQGVWCTDDVDDRDMLGEG